MVPALREIRWQPAEAEKTWLLLIPAEQRREEKRYPEHLPRLAGLTQGLISADRRTIITMRMLEMRQHQPLLLGETQVLQR